MLGNNKKRSLSRDEFLSIVQRLESCTSINELMSAGAESIKVKHSFYQYFPAVGSLDYSSAGEFHGYNMSANVRRYYEGFKSHDTDPVMVAIFTKGKPIWLSDCLHEPEIIKARHEKYVHAFQKEVGDGLCFPLYGPHNRKGCAFAAFGRGKTTFDPIMPYQIHSLLQVLHLQYCLITRSVAQKVRLTPREFEILELISFGKTNPEIALILEISPRTVAVHASKIFIKLGTSDRVSAAMRAQTIRIEI